MTMQQHDRNEGKAYNSLYILTNFKKVLTKHLHATIVS